MRGEFVDVGGRRLYYYAAGTRGAGAPVVLIHGFPTSSRLWHAVARDFPEGHRLIVLDLPGFGRSEPPADEEPTCASHARALHALLDNLGVSRAYVVGHGLGGGVAQAFAVQWPERVAGLALISSAGFGLRPRVARLAHALGPLPPRAPPRRHAGRGAGAVRRGFVDPDRAHLTLDTGLRPFASGTGREQLAAQLAAQRRCDTQAWSARLGELDLPATVIWGAEDPFYPVALGQRLHEALRGSSFEIIPGAAHFVPEDQPDALRRALERLLTPHAA